MFAMSAGTPSSPGVGVGLPALSRGFARWGAIQAVLVVLVGFVVSQVAGYALTVALGETDTAIGVGIVFADLLVLALVVVVARRGASQMSGRTLGLRRTPFWTGFGWAGAVLIVSFGANALLAALFGGGSGPAGASDSGAPAATGLLVLFAFAIAVIVPIVEEITFRGYLFPAVTTWRGPWVAAILTSLLFGAAHAFSLPFPFQVGAAVFGFGACLLYWFTGSLLPGIALHSFNNALVLAIAVDGALWPAVFAAPALSLLLLLPVARDRVPATT
jgi:membrane protease YdiL (CAAX protease family)